MSEKEEVNLIDKIEKSKWERRYLNVLREIENERKGIITGWIYYEVAVEGSLSTWMKRWFSLCSQYFSIFKRDNGFLLFFFCYFFLFLLFFQFYLFFILLFYQYFFLIYFEMRLKCNKKEENCLHRISYYNCENGPIRESFKYFPFVITINDNRKFCFATDTEDRLFYFLD